MFAGKDQSGTSKVVLSDANAKPRLTLSVDRAGSAQIRFPRRDRQGRAIDHTVSPAKPDPTRAKYVGPPSGGL